jgi:hypothetical protein
MSEVLIADNIFAQVLMMIGVGVFGLLGMIHLIYTFFSNKFEAFDPAVTEAMNTSTLNISREATVWNAWVGFNASHSLGMMIVPAIYIPLTISYFNIIQQSVWLTMLPVLIGLSYLLLAKKYWFKIPFFGILISTLCFIGAAISICLG